MPSQADDSFLHDTSSSNRSVNVSGVNALSGWWLISTLNKRAERNLCQKLCQCPLRLMTHFYDWVKKSNPEGGTMCQCPLRLMTHFYGLSPVLWCIFASEISVNALSGWWLISTITENGGNRYDYDVSMPSQADDSFLRYPFKNLGFMRFPEPVFAGIYQNILTTVVFRAC